MSLATEFGLDVEGVGAVEVDVIVLCRCQVCRVVVYDGVAFGTQRVERVAEVGSGPQHRGVGDQLRRRTPADPQILPVPRI